MLRMRHNKGKAVTNFDKEYNAILLEVNYCFDDEITLRTELQKLKEKAESENATHWADYIQARIDHFDGQNDKAIQTYDNLLSALTGDDEETLLLVAKTLSNKADLVDSDKSPDEYIKLQDEIIHRLSDQKKATLRMKAADASRNKAAIFIRQGKPDEAIAAYDEALTQLKGQTEPELLERFATIAMNKGYFLKNQGKAEEEIVAYDEALAQLKGRAEPEQVRSSVIMLIYYKADALERQDKPDEACATLDTIIMQCSDQSMSILTVVAATKKGAILAKQEKLDEAIAVYDAFLSRIKIRDEPDKAMGEVELLHNKGQALSQQEKWPEAIAAFDKALSCCECIMYTSPDYAVKRTVDILFDKSIVYANKSALESKSGIDCTKLLEEEKSIYEKILSLLKDTPESSQRISMAQALGLKGILLSRMNNPQKAVAAIIKLVTLLHKNSDVAEEFIGSGLLKWVNSHCEAVHPDQKDEVWRILVRLICVIDFFWKRYDTDRCSRNGHFYHYTTRATLQAVVSKGGETTPAPRNLLRIGNMEYVNDPKEGMSLVDYCRKSDCKKCAAASSASGASPCQDHFSSGLGAYFFDNIPPEIAGNMYTVCFTMQEDDLNHWRMYSDDARGVSIGIPVRAFSEDKLSSHDSSRSADDPQGDDLFPFMQRKEAAAAPEADSTQADAKADEKKPVKISAPRKVHYDEETMHAACKALCPHLREASAIMHTLPEKQRESFREAVQGILLDILYLFKDKSYSAEEEYRFLVFEPDLTRAEKAGRIFLNSEPFLFQRPGYIVHTGPYCPNPREVILDARYELAHTNKSWLRNVEFKMSARHYRGKPASPGQGTATTSHP